MNTNYITQMKNNQSSIINHELRVIFFGTPSFVEPVLSVLRKNFNVIAIIRNKKQFDSIINHQSSIINNVDFFVVASFGQILPGKLLSIPKIAAINIHPSLLPKYRGPSPIQTAILNGDTTTGITFIKMDEQVDHGPVIDQFKEIIKPNDTFESLADRLFQKAAKQLPSVITRYNESDLIKQDESKATYTKFLTKQDGFIDISKLEFKNSLEIKNWKLEIDRKIRAYYPWPGVWTRYSITNNQPASPKLQRGESSIIKFLPDKQIQVEGKNPMSYKDFINGYPNGKIFLEKFFLI